MEDMIDNEEEQQEETTEKVIQPGKLTREQVTEVFTTLPCLKDQTENYDGRPQPHIVICPAIYRALYYGGVQGPVNGMCKCLPRGTYHKVLAEEPARSCLRKYKSW